MLFLFILVSLVGFSLGSSRNLGNLKCPRVAVYGLKNSADVKSVTKALGQEMELYFFESDENAPPRDPDVHVFVSYSAEPTHEARLFPRLAALPANERSKWIHVKNVSSVQLDRVYNCFFVAHLTHVSPHLLSVEDIPLLSASEYFSTHPLVSVFAATFKSTKDGKIQRVLDSLATQTYKNWELVLVDDSSDNGATFKELADIAKQNQKIRVYLPHQSDGLIGATKRYAAGLCRGQILVEMDHDDSLEPNCLQEVVDAFRSNPQSGFVYGDASVWFLETRKSNQYGEGFAMGYGSYSRQYSNVLKMWVNVNRAADLNPRTLSDSVGFPNHVRAWRADFYAAIGGHNVNLPVADDIELLMRTFLRTAMVRIPKLGYIQYREPKGNNFTFLRLREIRKLQARFARFYRGPILRRLSHYGVPANIHRVRTFYNHHNRTIPQLMGNRIDYRRGSLVIIAVRESVVNLRAAIEGFCANDAALVLIGRANCSIECMKQMIDHDPWFIRRNARYWAVSEPYASLSAAVWYATIASATLPEKGSTIVLEVDAHSSKISELNANDAFIPAYLTTKTLNPKHNFASDRTLRIFPHSSSTSCGSDKNIILATSWAMIFCTISISLVFVLRRKGGR